MYRVELKVGISKNKRLFVEEVPNVPCGVESLNYQIQGSGAELLFLMYRVELKGNSLMSISFKFFSS